MDEDDGIVLSETTKMINRCFRHQHPEAYDAPAVTEPSIPSSFRYGAGEQYTASPALAEEQMGDPNATPIV